MGEKSLENGLKNCQIVVFSKPRRFRNTPEYCVFYYQKALKNRYSELDSE